MRTSVVQTTIEPLATEKEAEIIVLKQRQKNLPRQLDEGYTERVLNDWLDDVAKNIFDY